MIDRQRMNNIKTERLMLESRLVKQLNGVIKKLNDEVDMLRDKLKEKEKGKQDESKNINK